MIFSDILEFAPLTFIFLAFKGVLGMYSVCQNREIDVHGSSGNVFLRGYFKSQILAIVLCYSFKEPPLMFGVLQPNTKLRQAERLFENQLSGPESLVNIGGK